MRLLVIDTETGGLDATVCSILSAAGVIVDTETRDLEVLFDYPLIAEQPRDRIRATEEALAINGIDLDEVRQKGIPAGLVTHGINRVVEHAFGDEKPVLVGHNVAFDVTFLKRLYQHGAGEVYPFSHRTIDTSSILRYLGLAGVIDGSSGSSTTLFEATGSAPPDADRHTARGDALATAKAFLALLELVRP